MIVVTYTLWVQGANEFSEWSDWTYELSYHEQLNLDASLKKYLEQTIASVISLSLFEGTITPKLIQTSNQNDGLPIVVVRFFPDTINPVQFAPYICFLTQECKEK